MFATCLNEFKSRNAREEGVVEAKKCKSVASKSVKSKLGIIENIYELCNQDCTIHVA